MSFLKLNTKLLKTGDHLLKAPCSALCFTAIEANSTIELIKVGSPSIANTAYSLDGYNWITFEPAETIGTNVITLPNIRDKVYFRNDITGNFSGSDYLNFYMSGSFKCSGNINSIYAAHNFNEVTALDFTYCYCCLFKNCAGLLKYTNGKLSVDTNSYLTSAVTKVTAGAGLTGGDITSTGTIALATSGVTAGTYSAVSVDTYGRVTAGGQMIDVVAYGETPSVVDGGWYFEENQA